MRKETWAFLKEVLPLAQLLSFLCHQDSLGLDIEQEHRNNSRNCDSIEEGCKQVVLLSETILTIGQVHLDLINSLVAD